MRYSKSTKSSETLAQSQSAVSSLGKSKQARKKRVTKANDKAIAHKSSSVAIKVGWSKEESARLVEGLKLHGTDWVQVAAVVGTKKTAMVAA